jgi:hypothetical protein
VLLSDDSDGVRTLTLNRPHEVGNFATGDAAAAYAAFAERRQPSFTGRWAVPRSSQTEWTDA